MKRTLLSLAAVAAAALTAAGCGSSSSSSSNGGLSYSAFSQAADKICTNADAALKSMNSLHVTSLAQAVDPLNRADGVLNNAVSQFQALQGPSALTAARDTYVSDLQQASSDIKSMVSAAKSSSLSGFKTGAENFQALKGKAKTDGSKLGAPDCSK